MKRALIYALIAAATVLMSSAANAEPLSWKAPRTQEEIRIDGRLDEAAWENAVEISLDLETRPSNNTPAGVQTECYVLYDDRHVYVAFRAHDPEPEKIRARFTDRDSSWSDDFVSITFDTFNDQRRGYQFMVNPLGAQMDVIIDGTSDDEDPSWDAIWDSAGRLTETGYEVEIRIPFSSLRFPSEPGAQTWGFDTLRYYPRNVTRRLSAIPQARDNECYLCQLGKLEGFEDVTPGRHLEINPTVTGNIQERRTDFPNGGFDDEDDSEVGLNVNWGITPNIAVAATLNPDFSQVEADSAQLDINTRFALFFPERRPFFLEGVELFNTPLNAVFTRNVADPSWGVKLNGKAGRHAFGVFAADDEVTNLLFPGAQGSDAGSFDFKTTDSVARYRLDLPRASTLGVLTTRREGGGYLNQVAGVDGRLRFTDSDTLSFQVLSSRTEYPLEIAAEFGQPDEAFEDEALRASFIHNDERWRFWAVYEDVGDGFRADMGFVPQVGFSSYRTGIQHIWWGEQDDWYTQIGVWANYDLKEESSGELIEKTNEIAAWFDGPMQSTVNVNLIDRTRRWNGVDFDLESIGWEIEFRPTGKLELEFNGWAGDQVDFANTRPGDVINISPEMTLDVGKHLRVDLEHTYRRLDVEGGTLFTANLSEARILYQLNLRTRVRAILQYTDLERDPFLYLDSVDAKTEELFTQLLFSYKVNARTVVFFGYSDDHQGNQSIDLTQRNRTLFMKVGYAWVL